MSTAARLLGRDGSTIRLTAAGLPYQRGDWGCQHADWGTAAGWNWHLWRCEKPCAGCVRGLERDMAAKRRRFLMRYLGNGRYA